MQRTVPLHQHPELSLTHCQGWTEYRVEAPRRNHLSAIWLDAAVVLVVAYYHDKLVTSRYGIVALTLLVLSYLYSRLTRMLWESVIIFPSLGLQLETHRGIAGRSLLASRKFVPWASLEDILINEGIRGWDIRYYLVAINRTPQGTLKLEIAFENLLPRFPILLEVYRGVQDALHNENQRPSNSDIP